jgi:hypothetical protein
VLGVTTPAETTVRVQVAEVMAEAHDALRYYVAQVAASVRRGKPATEQAAYALLAPITSWATRRARSEGEGEPEAAATPTPPVVPGADG